MPLSSTAKISCDVNKDGGNDLSKYGPFNTIQTALNFMVAKYGAQMSADQHGVIYIGPGIYPETIQLTASHNYIDLVGDGRNVTIIEFSANEGFSIVDGGAVSRVCNLTIHCTATAPDTFAFNVVNNQGVLFEDCLIRSGTNCINNLGVNSRMYHCDIVSESTNSGQQLNVNISGLIESCYLEGKSAGGGTVLIGSLSGEVRNSRLNTLQSNGPDVRTVNFLSGGKLRYCTLEAQGRAVYEANGGSAIEFCYMSSEGGQDTPVVERFNGCEIRNCFFHQKAATNLPAVATGCVSGSTVKVADTTFFAPNCTGNVVANLEGDGSRWEGCRMIGADSATSGYALAADAVDRIVVVKDIVSNRPIDPLIRLTDNGLAAKGIGEAKGYFQKRWWSLLANHATVQGMGITAVVNAPGGVSSGFDVGGQYLAIQTNGLNTTASIATAVPLVVQPQFHPKFYLKFRLDGAGISPTSTGLRLWCGFFQTAPPPLSDILGTHGAGLFLSDTMGTPPPSCYSGMNSNGGLQVNAWFPWIAIDTNPHTLMMTVDDPNRVVFQMDNVQVLYTASGLPGSGQNLGFFLQITQTSANVRGFALYDAWCEFDS